MAKYDALGEHLKRRPDEEWRASFAEIESVLGFALPASARRYGAWWANELKGSHSHCRAWLGVGWHTGDVDLAAERVSFRKGRNLGRPGRRGASRWLKAPARPKPPVHCGAETVSVRLSWRVVGPIALDPGGRLLFARVDDGPAVYRFRFEGRGKTRLYLGETDNFPRRLQHYRTPGPTQQTNRRLNAEIVRALGARQSVTLECLDGPAELSVENLRRELDLADRFDRLLAEQAALAAARVEADAVLNL